jgi:hypothetical protein
MRSPAPPPIGTPPSGTAAPSRSGPPLPRRERRQQLGEAVEVHHR